MQACQKWERLLFGQYSVVQFGRNGQYVFLALYVGLYVDMHGQHSNCAFRPQAQAEDSHEDMPVENFR